MVSRRISEGQQTTKTYIFGTCNDNVEQVRDVMLQNLRRSAQWQALAFRLNKRSGHQILHKDLHYRPYKTQVAQELSERDKVNRLQFCNVFLDVVRNNSNIVNTLLMSVEARFNVSGYVNKQNCR
jgi:tRNA G37 N-methylase Trm5